MFNDVSSGAQSDLKEATSLAEKMVAQWGMSAKVGPMNLGRGEKHPFLGMELAQPKRYSDEMAWIMDQENQRLLQEAEGRALDILSKNRHILDTLAPPFSRKRLVDKSQIDLIIAEAGGKTPWKTPGSDRRLQQNLRVLQVYEHRFGQSHRYASGSALPHRRSVTGLCGERSDRGVNSVNLANGQ